VTSAAAKLTVAVTPKVTSQPRSASVVSGAKATFTVRGTGNALRYQWYAAAPGKSFVKVAGATKSSYVLTTSASKTGYRYKAALTNPAGRAVSSAATLTVITKPKITSQPKDFQEVTSGTTVKLAVKATGIGLTYQWQYADDSADGDGEYHSIKGATSSTYSFKATTHTHDDLRVVVANKAGKVGSDDAIVLVDSTLTDPYDGESAAFLNNWMLGLNTESSSTPTVVTGDNPTTVATSFLGYAIGATAETTDLTFSLVLPDGTTYDAISKSKTFASGLWGFTATATGLPISAATAKTGVWQVVDSSGHGATQYFAQH
jgi:hypothetical protein